MRAFRFAFTCVGVFLACYVLAFGLTRGLLALGTVTYRGAGCASGRCGR